ncbi:hypothetical protein QBC35DRAFT_262475 [Podospora australis]|uniref:Uncharacterized protein n=1 Tax=Podospora australis TaxID=1536484 RepID=A0AAN6X664_9PEZI|nr:hypothetical protein QBC35DRAFT_262475 [Podospora australis]
MESYFTDVEKRFVLAEMIKVSHMDVGVLVDFIKSHDIQPDWLSMQLPGGRNMNQCLRAAENMFNTPMPPPLISPLKRKSFSDITDHFAKRQAIASPSEPPPSGMSYPPSAYAPQQVNIQPRPNGQGHQPSLSNPPAPAPATGPTPYPGPPRRRGRPPKSESRQGNWQVTTPYPPITPAPAPLAPAPASAPVLAPQPNSPSFRVQPPYRYSMPDPKTGKKLLPEIAPRPPHGVPLDPPMRSPTVPGSAGGEYQERRDEGHRMEPPHSQSRQPMREITLPPHPPVLPPPRSPHPQHQHHPLDAPRPRETPPTTPREPLKQESHAPPPPATN